MKITSNIFQVGGSNLSNHSDAAVYLVISENEAALIDAGTGKNTERITENIQSCGIDLSAVKTLFITHCHYDHTGGAGRIRELTGCRIITHKIDAEYMEKGDSEVTAASWYGTYMKPLKVDIKITSDRQNFIIGKLEMTFHHTPGHSPGSSVLTLKSDGQLVLFGQDVHGPLDDSLLSNRRDYKTSLEFLLSLNADILCEGHFGVYYGKEKIQKFIRSYL